MGALLVVAIGLLGGGVGFVLIGFVLLPAFIGFMISLDAFGKWKGIAMNVLIFLLGVHVNPWIFWGWFLFLSAIGLLVLFLAFLGTLLSFFS